MLAFGLSRSATSIAAAIAAVSWLPVGEQQLVTLGRGKRHAVDDSTHQVEPVHLLYIVERNWCQRSFFREPFSFKTIQASTHSADESR